MSKKFTTKKIALMGLFTALSLVILFVVPRFPIIPSVPFLEYDAADIPIIIAAMAFGTVPALIITAIVCVFQGLLLSSSGIFGMIMHFVATGSFMLVFGLIYNSRKTLPAAIIGGISGVVTWTLVMIPFNLLVTPHFMGVAVSVVKPMILPAIVPFNLIKSSVNAVLGITLYCVLNKVMRGRLGGFNKRK